MASRALLLGALLFAGAARGQGCSQCRDNVAQTNPAVQASYRDAIGWMIGAVALVSSAMAVVIRRMR